MIDASYIKSILSIDDIISVMSGLGADYNFLSSSEIHFRSICHSSDSYKLYYYDKSKSFYCHRCGEQWDIFALVQMIKDIDFLSAVSYICEICSIEETYRKKISIDPWQKELKRFLPNYEHTEPLKIFSASDLRLFGKEFHNSWIEDGISIECMKKFNIGWYARNAQITIPVRDADGNLVGVHARNTRKHLVERGLKYQPVKTLNEEYKFPTSGVLYGLYENKSAIQSSGSVIICEAPKSVLQAESILKDNNTVALFGWNMQARRRDMLLSLGVKDVTIAIDRQYQEHKGDEFNIWAKQVKKIAKLFTPYCEVYTIWDKADLLGYKDSPFDKGADVWYKLYENRTKIS